MSDPYVIEQHNGKWDVIRLTPSVVAQGLNQTQADALAFALNADARVQQRVPAPPAPTTIEKACVPSWER